MTLWFKIRHARRECIARTMLLQDVCPSDCPSVTRQYSVDTAEHDCDLEQPIPRFKDHAIICR